MSPAVPSPPLVTILGPTASGKSCLAVWVAQQFGGEVVACDSTQLYRGFAIGTAKPSLAERGGIPHHLLDVLEPGQESTAGDYREMALAVLQDLRARGRLPIFTVGTGLYLRALLEGLAELPQRSEEIRERLRTSAKKNGSTHLHRILRRLDPTSAERIALADEQKLIRAIEVCVLAGKQLSRIHEEGRSPLEGWRVIKLGLRPARDALQARIEARTEAMLANGWMEEVKALVQKGVPASAKPFDFIGYGELRCVLEGTLALGEARASIGQSTRRYAKRQLTWFRRESNVNWFAGFGDEVETQRAIGDWLEPRLKPIRTA